MTTENNNNEEWCEEHEQSKWKDGLKCGGCLDDKKKVYELLDNPKPSLNCENCGETFGEDDNNGEGYKNEGDVAGCRWCEECWLTHKCADCDNHEDDVGDGNDENGNELNPRCSECRKKYEE